MGLLAAVLVSPAAAHESKTTEYERLARSAGAQIRTETKARKAGRRQAASVRAVASGSFALPAGFWTDAPHVAAAKLFRAHVRLRSGGRIALRPSANAAVPPAEGTAVLALGYPESPGEPLGSLPTELCCWLVRWWEHGEARAWLSHYLPDRQGSFSLDPQRWRHLLAVTQCLASAEMPLQKGDLCQSVINRGPVRAELRGQNLAATRALKFEEFLRVEGCLHPDELSRWGQGGAQSLRSTLIEALWRTALPSAEMAAAAQAPRVVSAAASRAERQEQALSSLVAETERALAEPCSPLLRCFVDRVLWSLAENPVAGGQAFLERARNLNARMVPVGDEDLEEGKVPAGPFKPSAFAVAADRMKLWSNADAMVELLVRRVEPRTCEDCDWAATWIYQQPEARQVELLAQAFPLGDLGQQRQWLRCMAHDPAAAERVVKAAVERDPTRRVLQVELTLQHARTGHARLVPELLAVARDRSLPADLRVSALRVFSPEGQDFEEGDEAIDPVLCELLADEPRGSEMLGALLRSVRRRQPEGAFPILFRRWQAGDFATEGSRGPALHALAACSGGVAGEERRALLGWMRGHLPGGDASSIVDAWIAEAWSLEPQIRELARRQPKLAPLAQRWLTLAKAVGGRRVRLGIAAFAIPEDRDNDWPVDSRGAIRAWIHRAFQALPEKNQSEVRAFARWANSNLGMIHPDIVP